MAQNGDSHPNVEERNGAPLELQADTSTMVWRDISARQRSVCKLDALGKEILGIAIPAILTLAADPVASLIDTMFIGRLGAVDIGGVGVAIAIFNQASRITMYPIVSITTSFVAEEHTMEQMEKEAQNAKAKLENLEEDSNETASKSPSKEKAVVTGKKKRNIPSATTAIIMGTLLGVVQALFLIFAAKILLSVMGVKSDSPMYIPARQYLTVRALGAPAVLLSLAMQGVFRGFKDTTTPLYATVVGDALNIVLDPIFIFVLRFGVRGAAISHAISQYTIALILFLRLMQEVNLLAPGVKQLQFGRFLKNGALMLTRVIAVTSCVTFAAALAARQGPTPMAAFQICLQVWLTSSLLANGLAVSGQAILAYAFAEKDNKKAIETALRVAQLGFVAGLGLLVIVGAGLYFGAGVFTTDKNVLHLMYLGIPVMMAIASLSSEFLLARAKGYLGLWYALIIYMGLRTVAGVWR
ncbi:MATE efflux family protein FRD3 [Morella rubra]|uniref:Protein DETOXIFICATION n=1 Tax=Morella rubra TaxID=262757 RepID=A0A6A1WLL5_9ROSI|nr:MATE efflux family protein FRD3 [Morella rubra]